MNSRERVRAALARRPLDRPPWGEMVIDDAVVAGYLGCDEVAWEQRREFVRSLGLDIVCLAPGFPSWDPGGALGLPRADQAHWGDLPRWAGRTGRYPFILLDGALGWAARCLGWQRAILLLARGGAALDDFIPGVESLNLALAARARDLGAEAALLAEDIAYQQGLLMSPEQFRATLLPSLARQAAGFKGLGLAVFFHSDGDLNQVMADLAGLGLDGCQCLESAAGMDLEGIRRDFGDRLCLWGNLDPAVLVQPEGPESLDQAVRLTLQAGGSEGGYIFGTSSGLMAGVRPESLRLIRDILASA